MDVLEYGLINLTWHDWAAPEGESPAGSLSCFLIWSMGGRVGLFSYCVEVMCAEAASLLGLMHGKQWGCVKQDCLKSVSLYLQPSRCSIQVHLCIQ